MIFSKKIIGNSRTGKAQYAEVQNSREMSARQEQMFARNGFMALNDGLIPRDVYQEFDRVAVEEMNSDNGDTFLNDLMPLSKAVSIGTLVNKFRQVSNAGVAQTSMTGQIGARMDQVEYKYDGTIVPIHDTGFSRNFREVAAHTSAGFDALIDDNREHIITIRDKIADTFMSGHKDKDGNVIVVDGAQWQGMTADARVAQVNIVLDFTSSANTGDQIKAAFISELRDVMWITNKCERDITYYISREIMSNLERKFSTNYDGKKIIDELKGLMGVADIKVTSKLSGNHIMGFPLNGGVRPIVGMAVNTVALPRPLYNSNHEFNVWAAIGWEVRETFSGLSCAINAD